MNKYLKAINPAIVALIGVGGVWLAEGTLDRVALAVAVVGAVHATLAFFVTNVPGWGALKAIVPPIINGLGVLGLWIEIGTFDRTLAAATATAVVLAIVTYISSNADPDLVDPGDLSHPTGMDPARPA